MSKSDTLLSAATLSYQTGLGNHFSSEAMAGALPQGRNSPQNPAYGLYAEQLSVTAFTAPRAQNRRSWLYRIAPSVSHGSFAPIEPGGIRTAPMAEGESLPLQVRWDPLSVAADTDFMAGWHTLGTNGDVALQCGMAVHLYAASVSMRDCSLANADGELLLVPQAGGLRAVTEFGHLEIAVGEVLLIPRGVRFRIELLEAEARGYICENYGSPFQLPELGPIGANGLASPRDFMAPVASFEDVSGPHRLITKFQGRLWAANIGVSPFDVVAWHGTVYPVKYDLRRFNALGTVTYDHPDPSIFTVLTSLSDTPGVANCDFVALPPRWLVSEDTFRPPYFHRNVMSEYMGLITGMHEAKAGGFVPGGGSLHNCMAGHGPDRATFEAASAAALAPVKLESTLAFMLESRYPLRLTEWALHGPHRQPAYHTSWTDLPRRFQGQP